MRDRAPGTIIILRLLFESPWLLLVVLVAVQFGLIIVWSWRRSRLSARAVWTGFVAMPTLIALSLLVVTPRERVIGLCRDLASMVDAGDVAGIARHLAEDFDAAQMDRDAFLESVERSLTHYHVDDARLRRFEVEFSAEGVSARGTTVLGVGESSLVG